MNQENKTNAVVTQVCHSPKSLWGIFRVRNARGVKQTKEYEEDPRTLQAAFSGMTTLLNNTPLPRFAVLSPQGGQRTARGFTLIELLVVILIIGILAAIAVPQYQNTVEKSRGTEAILLLRQLHNARLLYYLEHGQMPESFDALEITVPWVGTAEVYQDETDRRSTQDWAFYLFSTAVSAVRLTGPYQGAGFSIYSSNPVVQPGHLICREPGSSKSATYSQAKEGYFCKKLYGASWKHRNSVGVEFAMP